MTQLRWTRQLKKQGPLTRSTLADIDTALSSFAIHENGDRDVHHYTPGSWGYMCIYICIYMYVHIHVSNCIRIHMCIYVHMYIYTWYIYIYMHSIFVYIYMYMYICSIYIYICYVYMFAKQEWELLGGLAFHWTWFQQRAPLTYVASSEDLGENWRGVSGVFFGVTSGGFEIHMFPVNFGILWY